MTNAQKLAELALLRRMVEHGKISMGVYAQRANKLNGTEVPK